MSLNFTPILATISIMIQAPPASEISPTIESLREFRIAGEAPRFILLIKEGEGSNTTTTAVGGSIRFVLDEESSRLMPVWSARKFEWDSTGLSLSNEINQSECANLLLAIQTMKNVADSDLDLPTLPRDVSTENVPPPSTRLHRSYTFWSVGRQIYSSSADLHIQYTGIGGNISDLSKAVTQQLEPCWS